MTTQPQLIAEQLIAEQLIADPLNTDPLNTDPSLVTNPAELNTEASLVTAQPAVHTDPGLVTTQPALNKSLRFYVRSINWRKKAALSSAPIILCFIDAPDPDNFALVIALHILNPGAQIIVVLTGRPVNFVATKETALWEWDEQSSRWAQECSAARVKNFLLHFGVTVTRVFDGGIAPRTLVPHHIHFDDYYKFLDVNDLKAIRHKELEPQKTLMEILLKLPERSVQVVVGGPMTGLNQLITLNPDVAKRFKEVHAMFATWGNVSLMQFDDKPRGADQFNVACDPQGAHNVLMGLTCPIFLMTTEVTRVQAIGFETAQALRDALPINDGTKALYALYTFWYDAAVKPRLAKNPNERIFIHDIVGAFSLNPALRDAIYNVVPVEVESVPYLAREQDGWGKVIMKPTKAPTNIFAATSLKDGGAEIYLQTLRKIFA